jgi:AcrR family transcriptional regulator
MADPDRLRAERPERYRAILEAACAEFAERGYERGNVNAIAERVGVGKGTLYNYVGSKEDLFLQTVEYAAGRVIAHVKAHVSPKASPRERMRQLVIADLLFMDEHQDEFMLMESIFYGANFLYGKGSDYLVLAMGAYREFFALIADICRDWMGAEKFEARGGERVAFQVLALIEAANLYAWAGREPVDREADAERVMTMLTEGLGLSAAG